MIQIDRNKKYESQGYKFKNFICLSDDEKKLVLEWRNSPDIRRWMYNRSIITIDDHLAFIEGLKTKSDRYYWLVFNEKDKPIGVFNIINVDVDNNKAETGSYAKPNSILESFNFSKAYFSLYFDILGFDNMYSASDANNENILLFTSFWGIDYNRKVEDIVDGQTVVYKVCDNYTKEKYCARANSTIRDFMNFIRNNK